MAWIIRILYGVRQKLKEALIKPELPAAQGCATIFINNNSLKVWVNKESYFFVASFDKPWMDLFRGSLCLRNCIWGVRYTHYG